jgi:hypothetical protein
MSWRSSVIGISAARNFVILECTFYKIRRHAPRNRMIQ